MNRFRNRSLFTVFSCVAAISLAACGGSHGSLAALPMPSTVPQSTYTGPTVQAIFKITIPAPPKSSSTTRGTAAARKPSYVSSSTTKIVFTLTSASRLSAGQVSTINSTYLGAKAVTLGSGACPGSGPWTCTFTIVLPPGTDDMTIAGEDGSNDVLEQQEPALNVVAGQANSFSITLDANASTFTVSASSGFCAGAFTVSGSQTVPGVAGSSVTFNVAYTDPATKTIVGPGLPLLTVNGHTDNNPGGGGNGYTDGNGLTVSVSQSAQQFTLNRSGTGNSTIAVTATPPGSDGLTYSYSLSFTLQAGGALPAGLLAGIEQTSTTPGNSTGQVDLYTMTNPSDPTGFGTPSTLSPTGGPPKDVDNPQDLLFDTNGDLLVANGGAGNPDYGNFACIPAGAITTGQNVATIITTHADDPISLALGTDNSVGMANNGHVSSDPNFVEYLLGSTYAEASSAREIASVPETSGNNTNGLYPLNVAALPTSPANSAGSYAIGFSNGTNPPSSNACYSAANEPEIDESEVIIKHPNGSTTTINDGNNTVIEPLVAYDPNSTDLVILSSGACNASSSATGASAYLDTYSVGATPAQVSTQVLFSAGGSPVSSDFTSGTCCIAASSTGYVAIAGAAYNASGTGGPIVQVFQPATGTRLKDGANIPFDGTTDNQGNTPAYCTTNDNCFVTSLRFITGTKLVIGFESDNANFQGFYLYDVANADLTSPSTGYNPSGGNPCNPCYDPLSAGGPPYSAFANAPKFVAFAKTTNHPLAAAYHL
jgi:hypothetical protein